MAGIEGVDALPLAGASSAGLIRGVVAGSAKGLKFMMVRPSEEENRRESLRRVQMGAAGLGGVLLLVGLTNVLVDNIRKDNAMAVATEGSAGQNMVTVPTSSEALADLGVAPASDSAKAPGVAAVPDLEPDPRLQKPMDRDPQQPQ